MTGMSKSQIPEAAGRPDLFNNSLVCFIAGFQE